MNNQNNIAVVQKAPQSVFTLRQMEHSLMEASRLFEDSFLPVPFLVGDTLRPLVDQDKVEMGLDFSILELAILKRELGTPGQSMYRHAQKIFGNYCQKFNGDLFWGDDKITYTSISKIPVEINLIERNTPYFEHPTSLMYSWIFPDLKDFEKQMFLADGLFRIPNPIVGYLESIKKPVKNISKSSALISTNLKRREEYLKEQHAQ